jgi:chemotaxis protein methyltransferase CheR
MHSSDDDPQAEAVEIQRLLEGVYRRYGFDFRDYAYSSMKRRIESAMRADGLGRLADLRDRLLHEPSCMERFLLAVTVNVTAMFRDPGFYLAFRTRVVPFLRCYPFIRIWHVGCATGEEVYSMAILLQEEGLYPRCRIYATDMNEAVLSQAKAGIFPIAFLKEYTSNYLQGGGKGAFSEYYTALYGNVVFQRGLTENIVFSRHDLVTDGSFNEFDVILCRNVMIYFNQALTERVHRLLYESLAVLGFLAVGKRESIKYTPHEGCYNEFDRDERIYQRTR